MSPDEGKRRPIGFQGRQKTRRKAGKKKLSPALCGGGKGEKEGGIGVCKGKSSTGSGGNSGVGHRFPLYRIPGLLDEKEEEKMSFCERERGVEHIPVSLMKRAFWRERNYRLTPNFTEGGKGNRI